MRAQGRAPERSFLAVLALSIASFSLTTAVASYHADTNHARSRAITGMALPAIEHLAVLRTEFLHTQMLADDLSTAKSGQAASRIELDSTRAVLAAELASYSALPHFASEGAPDAQLEAEFAELSQALSSLETEAMSQPARAVETNLQRVHPALDRTSATAFALIDLNTHAADGLAHQIEATRERSEYAAFGLDVLCAILCGLAGYLAWRTARLYSVALESKRELLEARATELEAFSGRVAHDILNPLNVASLALQILERQGIPGSILSKARAALSRAVRLVDGLLLFARAGARPEPGALSEVGPVLDDALAGLTEAASTARVNLSAEGGTDCEVACHPGVLASLLDNLVANAIKYMGESPEREVTVRVRSLIRTVRFEVQDTGPGIPPELREQVFEPYVRATRREVGGIGLGLATVKKLCLAHGGTFGLSSQVGHGSTFWFELPSPWEAHVEASDAAEPPPT